MAARRLLIVMLILVVASTVAAALVPPPPDDSGSSVSSTSARTSEVPTGGELVRATLDADARDAEIVRVPRGDQVAILVRSRRAAQIEIERLGLLEDVLPLSPARFDVLAIRPGRFEIRRLKPPKLVGVLEVGDG
ncbi:MAG: hypothetical protein ACR2G3_10800 [Solirubrobacterales bacterium]